jgi:hypothetical protein
VGRTRTGYVCHIMFTTVFFLLATAEVACQLITAVCFIVVERLGEGPNREELRSENAFLAQQTLLILSL